MWYSPIGHVTDRCMRLDRRPALVSQQNTVEMMWPELGTEQAEPANRGALFTVLVSIILHCMRMLGGRHVNLGCLRLAFFFAGSHD
jgi:hypothetical protein